MVHILSLQHLLAPQIRCHLAARQSQPTYVKLMPDYSAEMPLWGMPWTELNLDPTLIDRLRTWQRQFDDHFHYERGWDDAEIATAWRIEREMLADALRDSVGPSIEVRVHPWPE